MKPKLIIVGVIASTLSSCYWSGVAATPNALREHWRGRNGEITTIKGQTKDDPYHRLQRLQETERTVRIQLGRAK